jgi:dienelactone hydrolase
MKLAMYSRRTSTDAAHEVTDIEFDADGTTLRGWLYQPRGRVAAAPAVVMAHGYNCIKELYLDRYAAAAADVGHVVLAYDHRNFGDSDGEPRQELDPWMQVRDYRNAITFVQTLDGVDPERIGIWGRATDVAGELPSRIPARYGRAGEVTGRHRRKQS